MFQRRRATRRIASTAALGADTPDGREVTVRGTVRTLDMVLRSPTTGRSVVAYAVRVQEPGGERGAAIAPFDCVELVPFAVEHATLGLVVIDSQFAELVLPEHRTERVDDRAWTDFCDERQLSPVSVGVERPLLAGTEVQIVGTVARRAGKPRRETSFRDAPAQLCLVGDFDHPLLIVDED